MWNGEYITPATILTKAKPSEYSALTAGIESIKGMQKVTCSCCYRLLDECYHISDAISESFGEIHCFRNARSGYICKECLFGFKYTVSFGKKPWPTVAMGHMNGDRSTVTLLTSSSFKDEEQKKDILSILLSPPEGYFFLATNKSLRGGITETRQHFLHHGVVNYIRNDCRKYIATYYDRKIVMDVPFLRRYVENGILIGEKDIRYYLRRRRDRKAEKEWLRKKHEAIEMLGINMLQMNIDAIEIINHFMPAKTNLVKISGIAGSKA